MIKISELNRDTIIYNDKLLKLKGIDKDAKPTDTIGYVRMSFLLGYNRVCHTLHVIPDSFPIESHGVIGGDFMSQYNAVINYKENIIEVCGIKLKIESEFEINKRNEYEANIDEKIYDNESEYENNDSKNDGGYIENIGDKDVYHSDVNEEYFYGFKVEPRCEKIVSIYVECDKKLEEGVIRETITLSEGVFLCPSIVKIINNRALTVCLNTTNEEVNINNLRIKIEPLVNEELNNKDCVKINKVIESHEGNRLIKLEETLRVNHLNKEEKESLFELCKEYNHIFHLEGDKLTATDTVMHEIATNSNTPINAKTYRYPEALKEEVNQQIDKLLNDNIIKPSSSPWNSPVWVVPKKLDASGKKKWRLVIDYRKLNEISVGDVYPLPQINDILDQLGHSKYFTTLDLASGFHQIKMDPKDQMKTAFSVPLGHYEFTRMPFGLKNAPATFQRLMNNVLSGLQGIKCFVYLDDIVVYGNSLQDHNLKLREVFKKLSEHQLKLQPDKCEFLKTEVMYLGHLITQNGVKPDPKKIEAVMNYPVPKNPKEIKGFLGLAGYYRRFINDFSKLSQPLTKLLKKDEPFNWTSLQQNSFETLKLELCKEPILQYPDFSKTFNLTTDASNYAVGSVLSQGETPNDLPIAYASRILNKSEVNYSTTEKELLAIVWSVKHFRPYLYGRKFRIITDHKPLTWLMNVKDPGSRLVRWRLLLEEYDYEIIYKQGKLNQNADALSRIKPEESEDNRELNVHVVSRSGESYSTFLKELERRPILSNNIDEHSDPIPKKANKVIFTSCDLDTHNDKQLTEYESLVDNLKSKNPKQYNVININNSDNYVLFFAFIKVNYWDSVTYEDIFETLKELKVKLYETKVKEINFGGFSQFHLKWHKIRTMFRYLFRDTDVKMNIFHDSVMSPRREDIPLILKENHSNPVSGHTGFHKTYKKIKCKYYWDTMKKDIKEYIKNCKSCQENKLDRKKSKQPMEITSTSTEAFQKVSVDIVGPLPVTENGNKYILTLQDDLTKFSQAYPLQQHNAETIADCFVRNFICKFGIPDILLSDQGADFTSKLIKEVSKLFKMKKINTTSYHPQSNGALERSHLTLADYLKHYVNEDQSNWDKWLDFAMFSYNTNIHSSTRFTPFELVFGNKAKLPTSITKQPEFKYSYDNYLDELVLKLRKSRQLARDKLIESKLANKQTYDKKSKEVKYEVGDLVYLSNEHVKSRKSKKLSPYWLGPYEIIEVNTPVNVTIKTNKKKKLRVHTNRLKHAFVSK